MNSGFILEKKRMRTLQNCVILLIVSVILCTNVAIGQWSLNKFNIDPHRSGAGLGAMLSVSGDVWIAVDRVWLSIDTGKSWIDRTPTSFTWGTGINFIDRENGLITTPE